MSFEKFPKMGRLYREIIITEKLDGTNAQVHIELPENVPDTTKVLAVVGGLCIMAGSRNKYITPADDNYGFADFVFKNAKELAALGLGRHFGEWWGKGIQRGYGLEERKFSLFNTTRWYDQENHKKLCPVVCDVVPLLYKGPFEERWIQHALYELRINGSAAAPGFMKPEGIVTFHTAANVGFKTTIENDSQPKGNTE